jgi:sulfur carrier protein
MKVILRYPKREVDVHGTRRVKELLRELNVIPETVLVIRGSELLTSDTVVGADDVIELRPVISGGARVGPPGSLPTVARGRP